MTATQLKLAEVHHKPALSVIGSDTSEEAARRIERLRPRLRERVYAAIRRFGALTAEELERETGLAGNTVRPRLVELREAGLIRDSGERRLTRAGRRAAVWTTR